jgi:hypothetical protein
MKITYFMGGGRTGIARRLSWDEASLTILCAPSQKQIGVLQSEALMLLMILIKFMLR